MAQTDGSTSDQGGITVSEDIAEDSAHQARLRSHRAVREVLEGLAEAILAAAGTYAVLAVVLWVATGADLGGVPYPWSVLLVVLPSLAAAFALRQRANRLRPSR